MSQIIGLFPQQKFTVWSESGYSNSDRWGGAWGSPVVFDGRYMEGGAMTRGDDGSEFVPSKTIVTQYAGLSIGMMVAIGEHADLTPVASAESIRKVQTGTPLVGAQDCKIIT